MKSPESIVREVQLTEKGTRLSEEFNQYIFSVSVDANKIEIKHAVEKLFGVHVRNVNTFNRAGKRKRSGSRREGRRSSWKRAIVTIDEGQTIDVV